MALKHDSRIKNTNQDKLYIKNTNEGEFYQA